MQLVFSFRPVNTGLHHHHTSSNGGGRDSSVGQGIKTHEHQNKTTNTVQYLGREELEFITDDLRGNDRGHICAFFDTVELDHDGKDTIMKKDYSGTIVLSGAYWDTVDSRQQVAVVHCLELALQWIKRRRTGATEKVFPDLSPNPGPSKASERKIPLVTDGTCRFADVLVNPVKLREIVVTARKSQTANPARYLQNKLLDLLFTKEELMAAKGRLTLDRHRQDAIQEFIHVMAFHYSLQPSTEKPSKTKLGTTGLRRRSQTSSFRHKCSSQFPCSLPLAWILV
ncbi:uncharacterized protein [Ambystoma mexicanum]|uniref:uncharacterized protein n=1 Tax=Ambystoma mexicanum TaxID=8296 RepID=UPI0037E9657F